jgi:hypothetical protein
MNTTNQFKRLCLPAAVALGLSWSGQAQLISNGGFETGLSDWTTADQLGSDGTFFNQTGTTSPFLGNPVPAPPEGTRAAMTDAGGPGSHLLYQDFVVPASVPSASVSFALFLNNMDVAFRPAADLNFATPALNQQARVDIVTSTAADPFSVSGSDVLLNLYQTQVGDALVSGYNTVELDITGLLQAHLGETLRLRFAEVDNVNIFNMGVDHVTIQVGGNTVPDGGQTVMLFTLGLSALGGLVRVTRK